MVDPTQASGPAAPRSAPGEAVCVFAPVTLLTVTLENSAADEEELHIHPGGQGVWVARMITTLGARAVLCTPLGGETGAVIRYLLELEGITVREIQAPSANGAWIQDRRGGERKSIWEGEAGTLGRHEIDELYSATLAGAMAAGVCVIAGAHETEHVLDDDVYQRLAADLAASGVRVVADLSGPELRAVLGAGIHLVKLSHEELLADGWAEDDSDEGLLAGIARLRTGGATNVVLSRAGAGAIAVVDDETYSVQAPELEVADPRGAGDSMTAALAVAMTRGLTWPDALRLAAAAGGTNVTRHGSGTGRADTIVQLAERVTVSRLQEVQPSGS